MRKWLGLGMGAAALLAIALLVSPSAPPRPPQDPAQAACRAAQRAVKDRLRTVATALFPSCADVKITPAAPDLWRVEGRFDADFLFGENARTGYAATVRQQGAQFEVTDLKIWP